MLAPVNPTKKPNRASFARMLAHLTFSFGMSTAAAMLAGPTYAQSCDRCAGLTKPNCGCETEKSTRLGPKQYTCACVPKLSLGEKILSHFERAGDRFEAKAKKPCNGQCDQAAKCHCDRDPRCGCEAPQSPSCGCESYTTTRSQASTPFHSSQMASARPFPDDPNRFSTGSIGDKQLNMPLVPEAPSNALDPEPTVQRVPFEHRKQTAVSNRVPAVESFPATQSIPKPLQAVPSDPPPSWAPNTALPQKATPTLPPKSKSPEESNLPDVLVDPFKDDASFRGTRQKMERVLLTSDRQVSPLGLQLASPDQAAKGMTVPSGDDKPARLTPTQINAPSLQFESADSAASESSRVVPSSHLEFAPVKIALRKGVSKVDPNEMPQVSKTKVPQKR